MRSENKQGTYLFQALGDLQPRWEELQSLLQEAARQKEVSPCYTAICRAASVLLISHLEGSLKEIVRAVISDLNEYVPFEKFPYQLKSEFVTLHLAGKKIDNQKMVKNIIDKLDVTNIHIDAEDLIPKVGNPNSDVINKYGSLLGVKNIMSCYEGGRLEDVFADDPTSTEELIEDLHSVCSENTIYFPYRKDNLDGFLTNESSPRVSFFTDFLDNIVTRRNSIAHGEWQASSVNHRIIKNDLNKVIVLLYGFILIVANAVVG